MDVSLLSLLGMLAFVHGVQAAAYEPDDAKMYMEACAKQELFSKVPPLNFTCEDKIAGGYYADINTACHIFHLCAHSNLPSLTDHPFCCHPELVFDQRFLVCDRPENVDCASSFSYYSDQFDGPVKALERENEETQARSRVSQSRDNPKSLMEENLRDDRIMEVLQPEKDVSGTNSQMYFPGKAVTLPPAFRQR